MRAIGPFIGLLAGLCGGLAGPVSAAAQPVSTSASLRLVPWITGLSQPVGLVADPVDPRVQYVIEKAGRIRIVEAGVLRPEILLDITAAVASTGEQGLLGLAFDPGYATTRRFWINYTRAGDGATVIARYTRRIDDPYRADAASRVDLRFDDHPERRFIPQPATNHNGGRIVFGPDGLLYVAMGDGGGGNDQFLTAQDPTALLGKILRLDVHVPDVGAASLDQMADAVRGYRIPPDNPFVDGIPVAARAEVWAFGVRNPWRVSFDAPSLGGSGGLYIADVGQGAREEVSYEPAGAGGRNYGWPLREGTIANPGAPTGPGAAYLPLTPPLHDYPRSAGISITGGYVYRGGLLGVGMYGRYVFGDLTGRLYSLAVDVDGVSGEATGADVRDHTAEVAPLAGSLVSIDVDAHGELFLVMLSGTIFRLTTTEDADGNGLPDAWEHAFGLPALGPDAGGPYGDPDGDGLLNAEELRRGQHPAGTPVGFFAEGATGFFGTRFSLLNDTDTARAVNLHWQTSTGRTLGQPVRVDAHRVAVVDAASTPGLEAAEFATRVEADGHITTAREMRWPDGPQAYGSHSERAAASPALVWHFAEGATTLFELFYLVQNTSADADALLRMDWRVQGAGTVTREYVVPAGRRLTIWVNQEAGLDGRELGATATSVNGVPLVVERAMYTRGAPPAFAAGHAAAGETTLATRWFFAEGATGTYFDTFLAVINPHAVPMHVLGRVFLQDGSTAVTPKSFTTRVAPGERATIWLDRLTADDGTSLDGQGGLSVELTADAPFVAERAMWWPGDAPTWHEAHVAAGIPDAAAPRWRVAGAEVQRADDGVARLAESYLLIANVGATAEAAEVRVYFTDRAPVVVPVTVAPRSRLTVALADVLTPDLAPGQRTPLGVRIDALSPAAQLYAEQAVYGSPPDGPRWSRGAAHRGDSKQ
jgi:glucose/arabinose dehydrogenase